MYTQNDTPLFSGLLQHIQKNPKQFHIPGHKKGKGMHPEFKEFIGENALAIDLINIEPLDDLHHPQKMIKHAQDLAAKAFHADHTYFSVQGTSGAIMTMIMSVCGPGDKIIVPRNIHKSVSSAIIFSGAIPIFIHPEVDHKLGFSHGITPNAVEKALHAHPDAKGVFVINPTYFGIAADLVKIVEIAHQYHIPVLVDEAHGVHIHFHDDLPLSAMQAGADMAATSVHKLGGSLTQSSILNIKEGLINPERVQAVMSMLTTTSTSYILLASLDVARKYLAEQGHALLTKTIIEAHRARNYINSIANLYCPGEDMLGSEATFHYDPTKLIISVKNLSITGHEAEVWLRENFQIEVELSDMYNILCIITPADSEEDINYLLHALEELSNHYDRTNEEQSVRVHVPDIPILAVSPRDAFYAEYEVIPLRDSAGRISAESIMVYPPGIPIFIPGEIISIENLEYIQDNIESDLPVQGLHDTSLQTIRVLKEHHAFK